MHLGVGDQFAGYRILEVLGAGGMGEVYLAQHPRLPRRDALKLLRADISSDPNYRFRFEREADLASTLWHPNVVGLHDRGEVDGQLWITMDFVDGFSAAELLAGRYPAGMPIDLVVTIVTGVARALDYAHGMGLLHRDVKPANIMVSHPSGEGEQRVLLADFGIARALDDVSGLTTTNMTVGTVAYAAPEQLMGEDVDGRADQYALAATAYHMLTGAQLYPHSNPAVVISRHLNAEPPALSATREDLAALDSSLAIGLSKDPNDRYARCVDLAQAMADSAGLTTATSSSPFAPTVSAPAFAGALSPTAPTKSAFVSAPAVVGADQPRDPSPSRPRNALIAAAAVALVAVVVAAFFVWSPWKQGAPGRDTGAAPNANQSLINTGPMTGVYTAEFGPELQIGDGKVLNPQLARGTFEISSACTPAGCVAIGYATDGPIINRELVFDDTGAEWISVGTAPSTSPAVSAGMHAGCEQGLSPETWETLLLRPTPSGGFTGQYEAYNANNCNTTRTISLTRTGDVDVASVDNPADLGPRIVSPAEGWRGHYRYTYSKGEHSHDVVGFVRTDCLRSGDRCMSYFSEPNSGEPFVFADGRWTLHYEAPVSCGSLDGPRVRIDRTAELELPQSATTPISALEGRGQEEVLDGGACSLPLSPYNLRFERTGD